MTVKLESDLVHLKELVDDVKSTGKDIDKAELQPLLAHILSELNKLEYDSKVTSNLSKNIKTEVIKTLGNLHAELVKFGNSQKIEIVKDRILNLQTSIELIPKPTVTPLQIGLKIGFYCDIDAPDDNNAIGSGMKCAIEQKLPFITTRSMLTCMNLGQDENYIFIMNDLQRSLSKASLEWDVFQKVDPVFGEEFVVFLPKSLLPEKSPMEKLQALDFANDGSLRKISMADALQGAKRKTHIQAFFNLFSQNPQISKLFYIDGHGSSNSVGGLDKEHYLQFLNFLDRQKCAGLLVSSCCSGGESSLLTSQSVPHEHTFTTIVRSIGDFTTSASQEAEANIGEFMDAWAKVLESGKPRTVSTFRKVFESIEKGDKKPSNFAKVYFPSSKDSPTGFRPLDERGLGYALTQGVVKGALVGPRLDKKTDPPVIVIKNRNWLEVHPLVTDVAIQFETTNPVLLSMLPGQGHHFLKSLRLANQEPGVYLQAMIGFNAKIDATKVFFIGSIQGKNKVYKQVALKLFEKGAQCVYQEDGRYYYSDGKKTTPISSTIHALVVSAFAGLIASEPAVRASSGGQESENMFREVLHSPAFWGSEPNPKARLAWKIRGMSGVQITTYLDRLSLSPSEKTAWMFFLLDQGLDGAAFELLKRNKLDPNAKDLQGTPLVFTIIQRGHSEMLDYLLQQGVDLAVQNPSDNQRSPLQTALVYKQQALAHRLLDVPGIKLDHRNSQGNTVLITALLETPEIVPKLIERGVTLDTLSTSGLSPLNIMILRERDEQIDFLIRMKVDINKGNPAPLIQAIYKNDHALIEKLLDAGAKAFEQDEHGKIPFVEALFRGSLETAQIFLERPECKLAIKDKQGITPLAAALNSGNREKIRILFERNAPLSDSPHPYKVSEIIGNLCTRLASLDEKETLKNYLRRIKTPEVGIDIGTFLRVGNLKLLEDLLEADCVDPTGVLWQFFKNTFYADHYNRVVALAIKKGADVNFSFIENTPIKADYATPFAGIVRMCSLDLFEMAFKAGGNPEPINPASQMIPLQSAIQRWDSTEGFEIFKKFVASGSNINASGTDSAKAPFAIIVSYGKLDQVQWCLDHGADVNLNPIHGDTPLQAAAKNIKPHIFKLLLSRGADINARGVTKELPLLMILEKRDPDLVEFCFTNGAVLKSIEDKKNAILKAVAFQNPKVLELVLSKGCQIPPDKVATLALDQPNFAVTLEEKLRQL